MEMSVQWSLIRVHRVLRVFAHKLLYARDDAYDMHDAKLYY